MVQSPAQRVQRLPSWLRLFYVWTAHTAVVPPNKIVPDLPALPDMANEAISDPPTLPDKATEADPSLAPRPAGDSLAP